MRTLLALGLLFGPASIRGEDRTVTISKKAQPDAPAGIGIRIRKDSAGALRIIHVHPNGPAARAGLQPGDQIFSVQGQAVRNMSLRDILGRMRGPEGTSIEFEAGAALEGSRLYRLVRQSVLSRGRPSPSIHSFGGIGVRLKTRGGAVVIDAVVAGSPAEAAGLGTGMRLLAVDGAPVREGAAADAARRIRGAERTLVTLELSRGAEPPQVVQIIRRALILEHPAGMREERKERRREKGGTLEECAKMEWHDCGCARDCDSELCQEEWYLQSGDEVSCDYKVTECFCSVCA